MAAAAVRRVKRVIRVKGSKWANARSQLLRQLRPSGQKDLLDDRRRAASAAEVMMEDTGKKEFGVPSGAFLRR